MARGKKTKLWPHPKVRAGHGRNNTGSIVAGTVVNGLAYVPIPAQGPPACSNCRNCSVKCKYRNWHLQRGKPVIAKLVHPQTLQTYNAIVAYMPVTKLRKKPTK